MLIRVDTASPVPLGDQIAAAVRGAIADGRAEPGQRLPGARQLAESLGVNVHTVLRGYQKLRDEGLIDLRRGRGAQVTAGPAPARAELVEQARRLVAHARALGVGDEDLLALLRTCQSD
ncbi:GntR family transcriptional regulator [Streptomyces sp. MS06]|uniref:GntR family transcriptional regulator n=1 Tax=Streptomyces sp. MS06 TaxID=3385974 RepID=UPI0039A2D259